MASRSLFFSEVPDKIQTGLKHDEAHTANRGGTTEQTRIVDVAMVMSAMTIETL